MGGAVGSCSWPMMPWTQRLEGEGTGGGWVFWREIWEGGWIFLEWEGGVWCTIKKKNLNNITLISTYFSTHMYFQVYIQTTNYMFLTVCTKHSLSIEMWELSKCKIFFRNFNRKIFYINLLRLIWLIENILL